MSLEDEDYRRPAKSQWEVPIRPWEVFRTKVQRLRLCSLDFLHQWIRNWDLWGLSRKLQNVLHKPRICTARSHNRLSISFAHINTRRLSAFTLYSRISRYAHILAGSISKFNSFGDMEHLGTGYKWTSVNASREVLKIKTNWLRDIHDWKPREI